MLLNRVRRIRGQVDAIERSLDQEAECSEILHNIAACRGAMDALMAEVIEGHIRFHVLDPETVPSAEQNRAAEASDSCAQSIFEIARESLRNGSTQSLFCVNRMNVIFHKTFLRRALYIDTHGGILWLHVGWSGFPALSSEDKTFFQ